MSVYKYQPLSINFGKVVDIIVLAAVVFSAAAVVILTHPEWGGLGILQAEDVPTLDFF